MTLVPEFASIRLKLRDRAVHEVMWYVHAVEETGPAESQMASGNRVRTPSFRRDARRIGRLLESPRGQRPVIVDRPPPWQLSVLLSLRIKA
jgi:hypothetical protein